MVEDIKVKQQMNRFRHLYLYMLSERVDKNSILAYLTATINCRIESRDAGTLYGDDLHRVAEMHARCRIKNVFNADSGLPDEDEVKYELAMLRGYTQGAIYDGFRLQHAYSIMIREEESSLGNVHIVVTDRLIATYSEEDMRYHLNTVVLGYPSIVSISGIVEAPAKPRELYTLYYYYLSQGIAMSVDELKGIFRDRMLEHDDPRLTDAARGYIMQAVFYAMLNDSPFCSDKRCMLYNAHWQDEVIEAVMHGQLCARHRDILDEFNSWDCQDKLC